MRIQSKHKGFTLFEVLIVVAIIGILTAIAGPGIVSTVSRYKIRGVAREMVIDFKKAKNEAVKHNQDVFLVFTLEIVGNPNAGGSYQMCVDNNNNDVCDGGEVYKVVNMPKEARLFGTTFVAPANVAGYTNRGLPWKSHLGTVTLKSADGARVYNISMSSAGGVRLQ